MLIASSVQFQGKYKTLNNSADEISRSGPTLGDLQAKLVTGTPNHTSPAVPVSADVRSAAVPAAR